MPGAPALEEDAVAKHSLLSLALPAGPSRRLKQAAQQAHWEHMPQGPAASIKNDDFFIEKENEEHKMILIYFH